MGPRCQLSLMLIPEQWRNHRAHTREIGKMACIRRPDLDIVSIVWARFQQRHRHTRRPCYLGRVGRGRLDFGAGPD